MELPQISAFVQYGWQCPLCCRVFAPHISECLYCNNQSKTSTTITWPKYPEGVTAPVSGEDSYRVIIESKFVKDDNNSLNKN